MELSHEVHNQGEKRLPKVDPSGMGFLCGRSHGSAPAALASPGCDTPVNGSLSLQEAISEE
jgi:hypothetical protein